MSVPSLLAFLIPDARSIAYPRGVRGIMTSVLLTAWPRRPWGPIPPIYPGQGCVAKSWPQELSSGLLRTERLSGIHTNAHYAAALRQRIRDLIGAKQSGFMPENGGLQCTNVRIPDSLSVIKSIKALMPTLPNPIDLLRRLPARIAQLRPRRTDTRVLQNFPRQGLRSYLSRPALKNTVFFAPLRPPK